MVNARVQTDVDVGMAMIKIPEDRMISASDIILAITFAHPTWTEEVILNMAREKRSIKELPDQFIKLLVYTTCMIKYRSSWSRKLWRKKRRKTPKERQGTEKNSDEGPETGKDGAQSDRSKAE